MSIRGLWVFFAPKKAGSEESAKVLFARRFPLVERRQKQFASKHECEYFPLPSDKDVLMGVVKQACSDENKFIQERDSCAIRRQPPTHELLGGKLWPVLWLQEGSMLYVAAPLAEPMPGGGRRPLVELTDVTVALQLLRTVVEIVGPQSKGVLDERSPVFVELFQFILWSAPFGSPLDLSVANFRAVRHQALQKGKKVKQPPTHSVQPAWRPVDYTGPSKLHIAVKEYIRASLYDNQSVPDVWEVFGTVRCKSEIEGHPDVQISLTSPKGCPLLDHLVVHPCVRSADALVLQSHAPVSTDTFRKIRFSGPLEPFDLCHYAIPTPPPLPIDSYYQMKGDRNSVSMLIQLKLHPAVKNDFEHCVVHIPFFHRGLIEGTENLDMSPNNPSGLSISPNRRKLTWNIGQKFPGKSLEVSLQCDVVFSSEPAPPDDTFEEDPFCVANNAYILMSFRTLECTFSGCRIDPRSVSLFPNTKCKTTINYEFSSTEYKVWNSHGDCEEAYRPPQKQL